VFTRRSPRMLQPVLLSFPFLLKWMKVLFIFPIFVKGLVPEAVNFETATGKNIEKLIKLKNVVPIKDNEVNLPIYVPTEINNIKAVSIKVYGLYHEDASDLHISLTHQGVNADVLSPLRCSRCQGKQFGKPKVEFSKSPDKYYPSSTPINGVGYEYTFEDIDPSTNIAVGKPTSQSTTKYNAVSARAVDNNTNGFFSSDSVTHTDGRGVSQSIHEPWWQVNLQANTTIGTIKIWNRQQEVSIDEIQIVSVNSPASISGTYVLQLTRSGQTLTTAPISVNAVAEIGDENQGVTTPGIGRGESMQAKIQELGNIGSTVRVTRSSISHTGTYTYTVTFSKVPGNIAPMQWRNDLSALSPSVATVSIQTLRNGNQNYVSYNSEKDVGKRLFPCWVMVFNHDPQSYTTLDEALSHAIFKERLTLNQRETLVSMRTPVVGSYVRVQLQGTDYLSLAEVQIFPTVAKSMEQYVGGSPIASGVYNPEETFYERFVKGLGTKGKGQWSLRIRDTKPSVSLSDRDPHNPLQAIAHGIGGLDSWEVIFLTESNSTFTFTMDLTAIIERLPRQGSLFFTLSNGTRTSVLPSQPLNNNIPQYITRACTGSCPATYGLFQNTKIGVDNQLSTFDFDYVADVNFVQRSYRQLIYKPNTDFIGTDDFTYRVYLGSQLSNNEALVTVNTRECRTAGCTNDHFQVASQA